MDVDIPVDGGDYVIEGKAPGYEAWSTQITVGVAKDKQSVNVPRFRERPQNAEKAPGTEKAQNEPDGTVERVPPVRSSGRKNLGVATLAGGGALLLGGLVSGYLAQRKWSDAKVVCGDDLACDTSDDHARGQDLVDAARLRGNVSTVLVGIGVVAVGAGLVLWLTAPSSAPDRDHALYLAPSLSPDGAALVVGGAL